MRKTNFTVHILFTHCSWDPQSLYSEKKILKMGPTVLFIHLKIILLQCFSVFSFSFQFSVVSKRTLSLSSFLLFSNGLVLPSFSCISLPVLLHHCNLVSWCFCLFVHFLCIGLCVFNKILCYLPEKKKIKVNNTQNINHRKS